MEEVKNKFIEWLGNKVQTQSPLSSYPKGHDVDLQRCSYIENELHLDVLFFDLALDFDENPFGESL
ncbi:MAG: hypothetical protein COA39_003960 [Sulfurimonas sp.]|nr:hypothetical protein [Sulfurimonas sp.]